MATAITFSERMKLAQLRLTQGSLGLYKLVTYNPLAGLRFVGGTTNELLIAPQDLSTADPTRANDLYQGYYSLRGYTVNCGGQSPFEVQGQPRVWHEALHEFGWLKHLRAAETSISRTQARTLVDDWIRLRGTMRDFTSNQELMTKRVIAWLCHSPLLLQECDLTFYRRFMRSLSKQVHQLRLAHKKTAPGMPRLYSAMALGYAAVCMGESEKTIRRGLKRLDFELAQQILPDGGHISRNPHAVITILSLLLPLRQAIISRDIVPSSILIGAIDRMMPMLRFFRMGDGSFAKFNGMGDTPIDLVNTILAYDDVKGTPILNAPHSGYQRLQAKNTVLIADTGSPPPQAVSGAMHAGCLAFELSDGANRMVVNCGITKSVHGPDSQSLHSIARSTAAHSTLSIDETSSCKFLPDQTFKHLTGIPVLSGPGKVTCERNQTADQSAFMAEHDGYVPRFNMRHRREIMMDSDGTKVSGRDTVVDTYGAPLSKGTPHDFQLRFHLHAQVAASASSSHTIDLELASGQRWLFTCKNHPVELSRTINISDLYGTKSAYQILLQGSLAGTSFLDWSFQRLS